MELPITPAKAITPPQRGQELTCLTISGIAGLTPEAKTSHPERWSGDIRNWSLEDEVWLNPERKKMELSEEIHIS